MTLRIIKYFLITAALTSTFSQTINSISISGNRNFSVSDYLDWINLNPGMPVYESIEDSIANRITLNLSNFGYFHSEIQNIAIKNIDTSTVNINVSVKEGEPTYIDSIKFSNLSASDSIIIIDEFAFLESNIFNKSDLELAISNTLDNLENIGYPFAKIIITSILVKPDTTPKTADINLELHKGEKSSIDRVEILGNEKTDDVVIKRAARIFPPVIYSQDKVESIPKKLNRLRFFEPVRTPAYYYNNKNEGVLQITVQEKETNNFDGIVGFVPGDENETGYFTGFLNVSLRNLFGTGRAAAIKWEKENRNTQELELKYLEPWVFGYPFNVGVNYFQRKQDTTYVQNKFQGSVEFLATDDISASLLLSTESIIPTENEDDRFTVYNSSILSTGIQLSIDSRDDVYAPTEGIHFINSYLYSSKKINGPAVFITPETETNIALQRLELDLAFYYQVFNRQVIASGVHAREMRGDFFELSDLYRLGGTNTLRGYRENQFLGNRIFWSNLEYRYLLTPRTFAFLFFDTGYYLRNADQERGITELSGLKYGYGLGLNLETALGILGVSFALGQDDSFSQGKIHFAIINEF